MSEKWVQIWGQAHSALSHFYYPSCAKTYRLIVNCAVPGKSICLELSNEYSDNDVYIGEITVAKCSVNGEFTDNYIKMSVNGASSFCLDAGKTAQTDPVMLDVQTGEYICISIFVEKGDLCSGNLLNNARLLTVKGNVTEISVVEDQRRIRDAVREVAGKLFKLFLHKPIPLVSSVTVLNETNASSIIVFGDSLCQQGFWVNRFEQRIREEFPGRYSVINRSIMGNRILRDFSPRFPCRGLFGTRGIKRIERDVLKYSDCEYAVIALGTNDFLQYGTIAAPKKEKPLVEEAFEGIKAIVQKLDSSGIKAIVFNTIRFGDCIDSRPEKQKLAREYNKLLSDNAELFYAVIDQAEICGDPRRPDCSAKIYLGKDYLHLNEEGGRKLADSIDLDLFADKMKEEVL